MRYKNFKKYKLPDERYRELLWFSWQYADLKAERQALASLGSPEISGMPHGSGVGDPTGQQAIKFAELDSKIRMIEECCKQACIITDQKKAEELYPGILKGVTTRNCNYNSLKYRGLIKCGADKFYTARRAYFWLLDTRRG